MSERLSDERLRFLAAHLSDPDTAACMYELLALRAEVERLRAVEKAARELTQWANTRSICPVCKAEVTFTGWKGHHPPCRLRQLSAALTANKQEPTT